MLPAHSKTRSKFIYNETDAALLSPRVPPRSVIRFHQKLPAYQPTPLRLWPDLADDLGVGQIYVKDESTRLGTSSFKILGASWAIACALEGRFSNALSDAFPAHESGDGPPAPTLLAASDGNHGRAVARVARWLGLQSRILVPGNTTAGVIKAVSAEGAEVEVVQGTYDDAVRQSAHEADETHILISDTSWPGYTRVPRDVMDGYSTMLLEVDDELRSQGAKGPDLVIVPMGVGAFAAAVIRHYTVKQARPSPRVVGVEPLGAACILASIAAGRRLEVPGPHNSIMGGLNCGIPSMLAWPTLSRGLDAALAIDDESAEDGMRRLAQAGILGGECAAAGPAAAIDLLRGRFAKSHREYLGISESTQVLLFATEGVTNPMETQAPSSGRDRS